jgi:hypothetical protein
MGQTSRDLHTRYKEHIMYVKNNDTKSAYAQHILDNQHEFGQVQNAMKLIHTCNRRNEILHLENLFIEKYSSEGRLIEEQIPHKHNILFTLGKLSATQTSLKPLDIVHDT